ncbi:MAG: hypothetical protein UW52_C0015G0009 [Candidatus Gottesmanbacteria bacterium GW2011_GWA1_44_24b]|uniref:Uncharacterized protein n=1 Tax=Candidatus Gottesmanbacteria bacterium GW2011_GWA1_44_24b TaxID=1618437 RepID=A0A0G1LM20_9BACT|nr:MAG: hypothetical protein UW52_C0015G0009 [Candidatus Gottesmanbacteria bacterium GW2011_GWA1_44_24b]
MRIGVYLYHPAGVIERSIFSGFHLYYNTYMKRRLLISGAILIFCLGFIIGKHSEITQIIAKELGSATPTPTLTPIPTVTPTVIQSYQFSVLPTAGGGPRNDIVEVQHISASKSVAQVGDDIGFSVTIKNQASSKKLVKQLCFNSTAGNFGCTMDFNLYPGQSFNFNNSGRFTSGGAKTVWITWTQDGQNFYRPVDGRTVTVTIQN